MAVFGLTGGIGAGKSTVCDILRDLGIAVVEADQVGRDVVAVGSPGLAEVVAAFGPGVLGPDGELNRQQLGAVVFGDAAKRRQLEAIMHPLVLTHSQARFAALGREGKAVIIYESALLFESKRHLEMQGSIVVIAGEAQRVARVQARDQCSADQVQARMRAQMSEAEKLELADYVLDNRHGLDTLREHVTTLAATLQDVAATTA